MTNIYITADKVGGWTGGSQVTFNESEALRELGDCQIWDRNKLVCHHSDEPWGYDDYANDECNRIIYNNCDPPKLAHFYAGTFSQTIKFLNSKGCKTTYTAAAHNIEESRKEYENLGLVFDYPHLTNPDLFNRYVRGYLEADRLIVPSTHSRDVMLSYGANLDKIRIIPHGVTLPTEVKPLPDTFTIGYLGCCTGPDKGLIYLLQAWNKLKLPNARLLLGGRDSTHPFTRSLIQHFCPNMLVECLGWQENTSDFYNQLSLYVQPSVTEGFGIEILEAMAHGRSVIASSGAGASDLCKRDYDPPGSVVPARDIDALAYDIKEYYEGDFDRKSVMESCIEVAEDYTWDKIKIQYINVWKELVNGTSEETK